MLYWVTPVPDAQQWNPQTDLCWLVQFARNPRRDVEAKNPAVWRSASMSGMYTFCSVGELTLRRLIMNLKSLFAIPFSWDYVDTISSLAFGRRGHREPPSRTL